ncbi:hypothetical protein H6F78_10380 [Coleofasciculus sp. FACHB-64]|uniref:hypothetical protein n=1 Tax=Cyanophyceae TaxID=3028117 RepID=UPI0016821F93|nr:MULTISPECIES: hypothetical protein [unclassified Coleofasciculus]MBD1836747.1 hypothetical protein [Coleofasciculus sp. FACHB-501]MBD2045998.1 hypothetical protein [Coleofasciculus sp. FACHB-64]
MKFFYQYIEDFRSSNSEITKNLADIFEETQLVYDVFKGSNPIDGLETFIGTYNWLGDRENKQKFDINQNLSRNLTAVLMQDYLINLVIKLCEFYPQLDVFTEVRIPFGTYPIWERGEVSFKTPSERSDLAVGYLIEDGKIKVSDEAWPKQPFYKLKRNQTVLPLVTINSKIRISQSEFFDWLGRGQLMNKGNPHCLSVQVALRKEMDLTIVEASQAGKKFFLLGEGGEGNVMPNRAELQRFIEVFAKHLDERMNEPTVELASEDDNSVTAEQIEIDFENE